MEILGLNISNSFFFYKEYPYPQKQAIINWLDKQKAYVKPLRELNNLLSSLNNSKEIGKIIIIEDGGFVVPAIHRNYPDLLSNVIGAVEQTARGIWNTEKWLKENFSKKLQFPVISVATSKLKGEFEPIYIGKAAVKNIEKMLPNIMFNGKNVGLFGYGTIGKEVAAWFRKNNSIISVFDLDSNKKLAAKQEGYIISTSAAENAKNKTFIVGSSGKCSIDSTVISNLMHSCYILSVSSEQYEIDIDELSAKSKKEEDLFSDDSKLIGTKFHLSVPSPEGRIVNLLANGYPINFWGMESMPEQASDLILSLILLSAIELALGNLKENKIDNESVNNLADNYEVSKKFLEAHQQG
jgi:adenosylhomocysteinase